MMAKAVTLHAPWGDLIMEGVKRYETRGTRFSYNSAQQRARGADGRLWIHNALSTKTIRSFGANPRPVGGYLINAKTDGSLEMRRDREGAEWQPIFLGHVIGYVDVVGCVPVNPPENDDGRSEGALNFVCRHDGGGLTHYEFANGGKSPATRQEPIDDQGPYGNFTDGRYAIELANPVRIKPFKAKGQQARPWTLTLPETLCQNSNDDGHICGGASQPGWCHPTGGPVRP